MSSTIRTPSIAHSSSPRSHGPLFVRAVDLDHAFTHVRARAAQGSRVRCVLTILDERHGDYRPVGVAIFAPEQVNVPRAWIKSSETLLGTSHGEHVLFTAVCRALALGVDVAVHLVNRDTLAAADRDGVYEGDVGLEYISVPAQALLSVEEQSHLDGIFHRALVGSVDARKAEAHAQALRG